MTWTHNVLVIANVTATSSDLMDVLIARAARKPCTFTLVVPATPFGGGRAAAISKLNHALDQLRDAGLEVDGTVGDADPILAVTDTWDPRRHDEIIVSTLPTHSSKWLHAGLPERVARLTGAPVTHVVSPPPKPEAHTAPPPPHANRGLLAPLSVLGWGSQQQR
jgi:hypothetical protein